MNALDTIDEIHHVVDYYEPPNSLNEALKYISEIRDILKEFYDYQDTHEDYSR